MKWWCSVNPPPYSDIGTGINWNLLCATSITMEWGYCQYITSDIDSPSFFGLPNNKVVPTNRELFSTRTEFEAITSVRRLSYLTLTSFWKGESKKGGRPTDHVIACKNEWAISLLILPHVAEEYILALFVLIELRNLCI